MTSGEEIYKTEKQVSWKLGQYFMHRINWMFSNSNRSDWNTAININSQAKWLSINYLIMNDCYFSIYIEFWRKKRVSNNNESCHIASIFLIGVNPNYFRICFGNKNVFETRIDKAKELKKNDFCLTFSIKRNQNVEKEQNRKWFG